MKIEHLLVQHFYTAKQVTLQGIGTFTLSPDFVMPLESDKDPVMPENAVTFTYDGKAKEDEALVNYIVQHTRKIKPLASADLESYIMLASQFLNIGKPLKIEGLGTLEKTQSGQYQFLPSQFLHTKTEAAPVQITEKTDEKISFANPSKPSGNGKKIAAALVGFIAIAAIGWAAWYFLNKKNTVITETPKITAPVAITPDTTKIDTSKVTVVQKIDSNIVTTTSNIVPSNNGYSFKVVIKNYPSLLLAQKSYNRLSSYGHKLILYTADSVTYKVAMPFTRSLADTAYAKDSVRTKLFGGKPYIEVQ